MNDAVKNASLRRTRAEADGPPDAPAALDRARPPRDETLPGPLLQPFHVAPLQPCPYLGGRIERKLWTQLDRPGPADFSNLSRAGFRRSHMIAYRPACPRCQACVSLRVAVAEFARSRNQARVWRRNDDLEVQALGPVATPEQFSLFERYLDARHGDGEMAGMGFLEYRWMVEDSPGDSAMLEFRDPNGTLVASCLADRLDDGFSAVYSFFDTSLDRRSLGTHMVLWLIETARRAGLEYVYLGYWIQGSRKMDYKARFRPVEGFVDGHWRRLD